MSGLKFDKRDLDMVLECLNDLKYEDCKKAVSEPYWEGPKGTAESVHELIRVTAEKRNIILSCIWQQIPINQITYAARNASGFLILIRIGSSKTTTN